MAKIVEYINPITGAPEQVDQLDHTAQEIDDAVGRSLPGAAIDASIQAKPNPNLLDNWYFGNPVNQRGQTEYSGAVMTIDRWRIGSGGTLTIQDGYITFASSDATLRNLEQALETLEVGKYTISLLAENAAGTNLVVGIGSDFRSVSISTNAKQVVSVTFDVTTKTSGTVYIQAGNSPIKLYAAKLELGSQQTMAHQDADGNWVLNEIPDYGEQLARCQRYYQLYSAAEQRPAKAVDCRPTMRVDPSQGTITIDGTTYYYNTADL